MDNYRIIEYGNSDEVAIVIPCSIDFFEKANRAVIMFMRRAKYPCKICIVLDLCTPWFGVVKAVNYGIDNITTKYHLPVGVDYFPSVGFLKIAVESLKKSGKKVFCFNDGKWFGKQCNVILVDREYARSIYGKGMFYESYTHAGGDTEVSLRYYKDNQVEYNPEVIFMEVDYEKSFDRTFWRIKSDIETFKERVKVMKDEIQSVKNI